MSVRHLRAPARGGIAHEIAKALVEGFDKHYRIFREASRAAKRRFECAEWSAIQEATKARIDYYDARVAEAANSLKSTFHADALDEATWQEVKLWYIGLLIEHKQPECAETFFNSVFCRILHHTYFHNDFIFVRPAVSTEHIHSDPPSYRCYYARQRGLGITLEKIILDFELQRPFANLHRDIRNVLAACRRYLPRPFRAEANFQVQVLSSLFYRNKGAYMVGKIINGHYEHPFVVPILHNDSGQLYLDAMLLEPEQLNVLFSANRAYFMVDMEVPSAYVQFLGSMLPNKPKWELYTILGLGKQGKTLFYRDLLQHLSYSSDDFIIAPGIKGLVMVVFTLPSFPYVFKVIKDHFAPPKQIDHETVHAKYLLVKYHDRVGRMADTLEYSGVAFPKNRFTPDLLEELRRECESLVIEENGSVILKHLYIERRMVPLNIFLDTASEPQRNAAIDEYGKALRDLAAVNIFAGDLLFKNFGVTRYGRVVFYDYDEIDYLVNCNFRRIPPPRYEEDELALEPWYSVGPHDIFPEEFARYLLTDDRVREAFMAKHADLFDAAWWQGVQARIRAGLMDDIFPYPQGVRFSRMRRDTTPAIARLVSAETAWNE